MATAISSRRALLDPRTLGPFKAHTKPWNAANFSDQLAARISRRVASTRGIVSLAAAGPATSACSSD